MVSSNALVILCLVQSVWTEDRISVDTVGTITATAGYSISDGHSPTDVDFVRGRDDASSNEASLSSSLSSSSSSSSVESSFTPVPGHRHALAMRSRQARGKQQQQQQQWQHSGETKDVVTGFPLVPVDHHRPAAEQNVYSVKPQTFDSPPPLSADSGSAETKSSYGKKTKKVDGSQHGRPAFNDWSSSSSSSSSSGEHVHMKFDAEKPAARHRKKISAAKHHHQAHSSAQHQDGSSSSSSSPMDTAVARQPVSQLPPPTDKLLTSSEMSKDVWQEVSPNMEMFSATVIEHDSSQESSSSSASAETIDAILKHQKLKPMSVYRSESMSSAEESARAEPQNFDHKQVLSKMNHFDFSNVLSQTTASSKASTSPPREKRLNYQPSSAVQHIPVRYSYSGGQPLMQQQSATVSSPQPTAISPSGSPVKSVKIEHPTQPNYHSIVVPIPISHQMYASIGGDPTSAAHGHQLATATVQQAMMSLPVVHNVFFKTDEHGGGQTMPAIVIPLKPEYLQQLQQQQYGGGLTPAVTDDSQNAAGHQRPVHHSGGGGLGPKTLHYQQQQQMTPSPYVQQQQQKHAKPSKVVKKPFGLVKDEHHRVKQPFGLHQHQFFGNNNNNPFTAGGHFNQIGGGGGGGHQHHQQLHGHQTQHDAPDDSRFSPSAIVQSTPSAVLHPFPTVGHSPLVVKRPNAYGYVAPKYVTVHKNPPAPQQQQLQQPMSTEELATAIAQQQQQQQQQQHHQHVMQPAYKTAGYNPGYAYLSGQDEDYPYRPIYKDMNKRNDEPLQLQGVRNERRK